MQEAGEVHATIQTLASRDVKITLRALVRTMVDSRRLAARAIDEALTTMDVPITVTSIPLRAEFQNATVLGLPLAIADPHSVGAQAYDRLATELGAGVLGVVAA